MRRILGKLEEKDNGSVGKKGKCNSREPKSEEMSVAKALVITFPLLQLH